MAAAALVLGGAAITAQAAERPWVEARSPHFQVLCDDGERSARRVALRFEQIRAAFASLGPGLRLSAGQPFTVIAARDERSLSQLLPGYFEKRGGVRPAGLFIPASQRVFVLIREDVDDDSEGLHSVVFHEYVHLLVSLNFGPLPLWLNEGLAEFYAHTSIQSERVLVGRAAPWHIALLRDRALVPFDEFFAADHRSRHYNEADRASIFYAQSWAMTHWLLLGNKGGNRDRLKKLIAGLNAGATPAEASRALGTKGELGLAMDLYVSQHGYYARKLPPVEVDPSTFAVRTVSPGEMAGWRALVHVRLDRKDDARRSIDDALRLAPEAAVGHEASALLLTEDEKLAEARAAAAEAIRLDPRSMPALMAAGELALMPGGAGAAEAVRLYDAAVQAAPEHALALVALADARAQAGAPSAETLDLAKRAVVLWPSSLPVRLNLAQHLMRHGNQGAALSEAEGALVLATTDDEKAAVRTVVETIKAGPRRAASPADSAAQGLAAQRRACDQGQAAACLRAGAELRAGKSVPADAAAAAALFDKACSAGQVEGCYFLAAQYQLGEGVDLDVERARGLHQTACDAGHGGGCLELANLSLRSDGTSADPVRTADLYEKACGAGEAEGCGYLGNLVALGRGRPADLEKAYALYKKGCDAGDASSCDSQGQAHLTGRGTSRDAARAVELLDKACATDAYWGCARLGQWLTRSEGGKDYARAARVFDRACEGGEPAGCAGLAALHLMGQGVPLEPVKAAELLKRACAGGHQPSCPKK
jgi:TPR repeat protein